MSNPFVYTDRDFPSLRNQMTDYVRTRIPDWTADPSDFAYSLIEAMAYLGDMMSYYVDRAAQESNILTANNPSTVFNYARIFGYSPGLAESAACSVNLTNNGTDPVTIQAGTPVGSHSGGYSYEIREEVLLAPGASQSVTVLEGTSKYVELGVSSGAPSQTFVVSDSNIDGRRGTLYAVTWNPLNTGDQMFWDYTELLLDESSDNYSFTVYLNDDGTSSVVFGDGVAGVIPTAGWSIGLYYRTCHGAEGNSPGAVLNRFLVSWDSSSISGYNSVEVHGESPSGGWNAETVEQVRTGALNLLSAQRRAVTINDYENLCRADSRVMDSACESLVWSRPNVWVAPREESQLDSLVPAGELCTDLERMLSKLAPAGVSPTVQSGTPLYFKAKIKILIPSTVDEEYATKRVKDAVFEKFSYQNGVFLEMVAADHLIRAVHLGVPNSVVNFVQVEDLQVAPDWKVVRSGGNVAWAATGTTPPAVRPKATEFAVIHDPKHIEVTVEKITVGKSRF